MSCLHFSAIYWPALKTRHKKKDVLYMLQKLFHIINDRILPTRSSFKSVWLGGLAVCLLLSVIEKRFNGGRLLAEILRFCTTTFAKIEVLFLRGNCILSASSDCHREHFLNSFTAIDCYRGQISTAPARVDSEWVSTHSSCTTAISL